MDHDVGQLISCKACQSWFLLISERDNLAFFNHQMSSKEPEQKPEWTSSWWAQLLHVLSYFGHK